MAQALRSLRPIVPLLTLSKPDFPSKFISRFTKPFSSSSVQSQESSQQNRKLFKPANPNYTEFVHLAYERQSLLQHLGVKLREVSPGYCEFGLPYSDKLMQHHGYYHGGAIASVTDVAGGFAAATLIPINTSPLTVEMKINFTAAAQGKDGSTLIAKGRVIKNGKTLIVTGVDVYWRSDQMDESVDDDSSLCATAIQTIFVMPDKIK
ncbi:HotDog domain-containing protein [Endogone sp. FLAS-F59071]|nr:HotDog domain-containing protein [Endogone sp. FLAS-F59071]|eukprot:RUS17865.1 HotDog domain-containing protein [Endogone sp. FLAS-F59071]